MNENSLHMLYRLYVWGIKVSAEESVGGSHGAAECQSAVIWLLIPLWSHFTANADSDAWRSSADEELVRMAKAEEQISPRTKRKLERSISQTSCDMAAASVLQHGFAHRLPFYRLIFIFALLFCSPSESSGLCNDLICVWSSGTNVTNFERKEDKIGLYFSWTPNPTWPIAQ